MDMRDHYFKMISERGSETGTEGGLLDLLTWCKKTGLYQVTEEEARGFWEHPEAPYQQG